MLPQTPEEWNAAFAKATDGHLPSGGTDLMYPTGLVLVERLKEQGCLYGQFLDFGCGNGRLAPGAIECVNRYVGLDIVPGSIEFCRDLFGDEADFVLLDAANPFYREAGDICVPLPFADGEFDTLAALSVFSHFGTYEVADHYMSELARIVKPEGRACVSLFTAPPNPICREEERTVYTKDEVRQLLKGRFHRFASTGGTTTGWNDQLFLYLKRQ